VHVILHERMFFNIPHRANSTLSANWLGERRLGHSKRPQQERQACGGTLRESRRTGIGVITLRWEERFGSLDVPGIGVMTSLTLTQDSGVQAGGCTAGAGS
jgi:hypothetical protein